MKRLLLILVVLGLVAVGGWFALKMYLRSPQVTHQVAARIEEVYGGKVSVGAVDIGIGGSDVRDVQLYEKEPEKPSTQPEATPRPWLQVRSLTTDVSFLQILSGNAEPHRFTIDGAVVTLRFDREGRLLTALPLAQPSAAEQPPPIPDVDLQGAEVVFQKEGQPDVTVKNVQVKLAHGAGGLVLSGQADNAELGKLILSGKSSDGSNVEVSLKTERPAHVDQPILDRMPFVPASVWRAVQIPTGVTPAELTVRYNRSNAQLRYRLDMSPTETSVKVPAIELAATGAHGGLVVEDGQVLLQKVEGQCFKGALAVDGDLDFAGPISKLDFPKITAKGLDVSMLPRHWRFPPQIKGELFGSATLHVTIASGPYAPDSITSVVAKAVEAAAPAQLASAILATLPDQRVSFDGKGKGEIRHAFVGGQPADAPIKITWRPGGFATDSSSTQAGPEPSFTPLALLALTVSTMSTEATAAESADPAEANGVLNDALRDAGRRTEAQAKKNTSYIDVQLKLKDVDLGGFIKGVGLKLPYKVQGKLSFEVKASLPVDTPTDLKTYRARGTAEINDLHVMDLKLAEAKADIDLKDGILELKTFSGRFPSGTPGTFEGTGRMQVAPLGGVQAKLRLAGIPLVDLPLPKDAELGGEVSGDFSLNIPDNKLQAPLFWQADADLNSKELTALGQTLTGASAGISLRLGIVTLSKFQGQLDGAPVTASGKVLMFGEYPYDGQLALRDWDVSALTKLSPNLRPPVPVAGRFTTTGKIGGTFKPFILKASGKADARDLRASTFAIDHATFDWTATDKQVVFEDIDARLYGGEVTGKAALPLKAEQPGNVKLHVDKLDAAQIVKALPVKVNVAGQVQGNIDVSLPPADGKERTATASMDLTAPKLRFQNIPTEQLHAAVDYKKGIIGYRVEGKALGGTIEADGEIPTQRPVEEKKKEGRESHLRVRGISLHQLTSALNIRSLAPLLGRADLNLAFTEFTESGLPEGEGQLVVNSLRWQNQSLADRFQATLTIRKGIVRLRDLGGPFAQGTMRGQVAYDLARPERSYFVLILNNVDAAQLLAAFPDVTKVEGIVNACINGTLGSEWSGQANIELTRGKIYGVDVTEWHVPASWRFAPAQNRGQIDIYETNATVARGRALGKLSVVWDYTAQVSGQVRFFGVDVQSLLRETTGSAQLGAGQMTGQFDFGGQGVRSLSDLTGTLRASFNQTQALQVPVLSQLAPFVGVGPSTTFQKGSLDANLDRGVWQIKSLILQGGRMSLFLDGTVAFSGALNLEMIAQTQTICLPGGRLRLLGLQIPAFGPLPLTLAQEAAALLSNQVVYLRVTGTLRSPVIRLEPLRTLTEDAARFFLLKNAFPTGS